MERVKYTINNCYLIPQHYSYADKYWFAMINNNKEIIKDSRAHVSAENDQTFEETITYDNVYHLEAKKIIYLTIWPWSYGHIMDSLFSLYQIFFYNNYHQQGYKVLSVIPHDNVNMILFSKFLFGDFLINAFDLPNTNLIKIDECILYRHYPDDRNFLLFDDKYLINKIRELYNDETVISDKNIFISRTDGGSSHGASRILENIEYINQYFADNNFTVINPEKISEKKLYNSIKNASNIIITNGSALCSLIFANRSTKIFCLNSSSYLPEWRRQCASQLDVDAIVKRSNKESLYDFEKSIWKKFVNQFDFTYVDSFLNNISTRQLEDIITSLKHL